MGRSQKWPDLSSPISKIRDIRFVGTDDLIIFRKLHIFPWNIVAVARLESYFVVGSLDLTWWPDLTWHLVEIFTKVAKKMGGKVGENPAGAARRRIFASLEKPEGGGAFKRPPPAGRGLTYLGFFMVVKNRKGKYHPIAGHVSSFSAWQVSELRTMKEKVTELYPISPS